MMQTHNARAGQRVLREEAPATSADSKPAPDPRGGSATGGGSRCRKKFAASNRWSHLAQVPRASSDDHVLKMADDHVLEMAALSDWTQDAEPEVTMSQFR